MIISFLLISCGSGIALIYVVSLRRSSKTSAIIVFLFKLMQSKAKQMRDTVICLQSALDNCQVKRTRMYSRCPKKLSRRLKVVAPSVLDGLE